MFRQRRYDAPDGRCKTRIWLAGSGSWGKRFTDGREELAGFVPNSKTVIVDGAGHWVHHDNLPEFVRLVREFLAG